jgi:hypothetical protein
VKNSITRDLEKPLSPGAVYADTVKHHAANAFSSPVAALNEALDELGEPDEPGGR